MEETMYVVFDESLDESKNDDEEVEAGDKQQ